MSQRPTMICISNSYEVVGDHGSSSILPAHKYPMGLDAPQVFLNIRSHRNDWTAHTLQKLNCGTELNRDAGLALSIGPNLRSKTKSPVSGMFRIKTWQWITSRSQLLYKMLTVKTLTLPTECMFLWFILWRCLRPCSIIRLILVPDAVLSVRFGLIF